jgi:HAD superfamily hydrolase (TIGR01450 family)
MRWVLDLDGVVWLSGQPIPGSPEAVARLKAEGHSVVFLTNNSGPTRADFAQRLADAGVAAEPEELATSAQAAASLLEPGSTAVVLGGAGLHEALADRGVIVVEAGDHPDAVVVGRSLKLDYDELATLSTAIRGGVRFVATNADPTFPTPNGLVPGAGALTAFLTTASSRQPEIAGKPHPASAALIRSRYGAPDVMVGDQPATDGEFAKLTEARFALVLSGVTSRADLPVTPAPSIVADDLAAVVKQLTS